MNATDAPPGWFRWSPRAYVLYAVAATFVFAAVVLRNPAPLFVAVPLLLGPIAATFGFPRSVTSSTLQWDLEGSRDQVRVTGTFRWNSPIRNGRMIPIFAPPPSLREAAPPEREGDPAQLHFALTYRIPGPSLMEIPCPRLVWHDAWGLVEHEVPVVGGPLSIERFPPEIHRLDRIRLERTTPSPGEMRSRMVGSAGEYFAVRPSVSGDTRRQINWRATARAGKLLANDYHLERTGDLLLLLDLRPTGLGPARDDQMLNVARAAAFGIADAFLAQKSRVGVGVFTDQLAAVRLGTGRLQRFRIRALLRDATMPAEGGPPERFAISVRRFFPPGAFTILISPLVEEDSILVLPHLRRRGFPTVVLSPSPLAVLGLSDSTEEDRVATRLVRIVRRQRLGDVWRQAPVIDWDDYWSLAPFIRFLQNPAFGNRRT
ncbi:MAG: DUF58 domain-containing protein [Thermoplasmata archaeon]